ncbi:YncE family protein [Saccharopolyspora phatthalungensis]|uniref:DNA-binding beta-propeller fold protein YncE n=1 Tax=Saccharopolyspora phatthalungensis TaxID=664693 RepID=A0A840QG36_9PSEU|nr:YncE family protein [Saccharopolyspora phatthalungensis]MBB5159057.1 DNA-binding beta-propeller fold protein YncE [Saccharopolyspora phatthalungensis]
MRPSRLGITATFRRGRGWLLVVLGVVVLALAVVLATMHLWPRAQPTAVALPLRAVGEVELPGGGSRFDYASLDADRGVLFVAHLGASEVIEVDVRSLRVVRVIPNVSQVHGVLVVPALHRVYATATGRNAMVALDEDSGQVVNQSPTEEYPDGLAFDPRRNAVWTTNEKGGSETVIDAVSGAVRGTVALGAEVGNVAYDPVGDQMLVDVQGRNELAVLDPSRLAITRRIALPGCDHDHGLALDPAQRLAFVACDGNATLMTVEMNAGTVTDTAPVGREPDVLAYDPGAQRLYVAAESGWLTVLDLRDRRPAVVGSGFLADGSHVVAVDPTTHHSYYPVPTGSRGQPALLDREPVS